MRIQQSAVSTRTIMLVLIFAELTSAFESSMIYVALSTLHRLYGDPVAVGWLVTSFLLVSAAAAALCGRLGDIYGRSRVLIAMLALACIGSLISALSSDLGWIIFGRAIQGAAAAILPLCYGLVRERFPAVNAPFGVGIIAGTAALGAALGYVLGGAIVDHLPWRWLFYFSAGLAAFGLVLAYLLLPPSARSPAKDKLDVLGGVLFVPAITGILYAITRSKDWGWIDIRTLSMIGASLAIFMLWIWHELRQKNPLIDVRLFANRQIALANLGFGLIALGALQSQMILLPLMQQPEWTLVGLGASATLAGAIKGSASLIGTLGAPWSGHVSRRRGGRFALLCGAGLLTLVWIGITFYHGSLWFIAIAGALSVIGSGIIYAAVPNLILEVAPADRASETTGLSSVVRAVFGAMGAQTLAYLLATSTISDPANGPGVYPTEEAYMLASGVVAAACALCLLIGLLLPRRQKAEASGTASPAYGVASHHGLRRS